ncbi:shieldin complex subunit 3 [Pelmatolapia mariae]|uniref:shieldin complex subunit 3 n=1 Tax=Pelmatolapia mariae TaxID=158779 RepID=UPI002FE60497
MEDVVLHYQPGSADELGSLLETTQKLLEPFPLRAPPAFTPWFPTLTGDRPLPIRPAKPAPVVTCLDDSPAAEVRPRDGDPETHCNLHPVSPNNRPEKQPHKDKDGAFGTGSEVRRSRWSVFTQRGVLQQSLQSLSKQFHHAVSVHGLHLHQRAKWVIGELNCGAARDIEEVWRTLSRSARTSCLPSCNANIQRERGEIWVFCDVLHSEQVGRFLKEELRLSGRIGLSVHRLGNVFSM